MFKRSFYKYKTLQQCVFMSPVKLTLSHSNNLTQREVILIQYQNIMVYQLNTNHLPLGYRPFINYVVKQGGGGCQMSMILHKLIYVRSKLVYGGGGGSKILKFLFLSTQFINGPQQNKCHSTSCVCESNIPMPMTNPLIIVGSEVKNKYQISEENFISQKVLQFALKFSILLYLY